MRKTALLLANSAATVGVRTLEQYASGWLIDCEIRQLSPNTIENRRFLVQKLLWFLRDREYEGCGVKEIKEFLAYVSTAHNDTHGRWNNEQMRKKVRPATFASYFTMLRTLFRYLVEEGVTEESPVESIKAPVFRKGQVQPFTQEQINAMLGQARQSKHRRRDEAIVLFLLDTGVRASELCALKMKDLDLEGRKCNVLGKGSKRRMVCFGRATTKALWQYPREDPRESGDYLFYSDRGQKAGEGLTRSGLLQLIHRLGEVANIQSARCSPHTFRHTFAVDFLRAGGNVFTLKELLGHTSLTIVNQYVALAQADIENQHRQFSPVDRLRSRAS